MLDNPEFEVLQAMQYMTEQQKHLFANAAFRLANGDNKTKSIVKRWESGQISSNDLLHALDDGYEYAGISRRMPYEAHYRDKLGVWYTCSFENAPNWEYWGKLDASMQQVIMNYISH